MIVVTSLPEFTPTYGRSNLLVAIHLPQYCIYSEMFQRMCQYFEIKSVYIFDLTSPRGYAIISQIGG